MSIETTVALSRHPMICGLKDATGDNTRVGPMRAICGDDFKLYSGEDAMAREYVPKGSHSAGPPGSIQCPDWPLAPLPSPH